MAAVITTQVNSKGAGPLPPCHHTYPKELSCSHCPTHKLTAFTHVSKFIQNQKGNIHLSASSFAQFYFTRCRFQFKLRHEFLTVISVKFRDSVVMHRIQKLFTILLKFYNSDCWKEISEKTRFHDYIYRTSWLGVDSLFIVINLILSVRNFVDKINNT